jgi:hypothetical protein
LHGQEPIDRATVDVRYTHFSIREMNSKKTSGLIYHCHHIYFMVCVFSPFDILTHYVSQNELDMQQVICGLIENSVFTVFAGS